VARAFARTDRRVALVASSSWSPRVPERQGLAPAPGQAADQHLYDAFVRRDWAVWTGTTGKQVVDAGQHEMLNWSASPAR